MLCQLHQGSGVSPVSITARGRSSQPCSCSRARCAQGLKSILPSPAPGCPLLSGSDSTDQTSGRLLGTNGGSLLPGAKELLWQAVRFDKCWTARSSPYNTEEDAERSI